MTQSAVPETRRRPSLGRRLLFAAVPVGLLVAGLAAWELALRLGEGDTVREAGEAQAMLPDPDRLWRLPAGRTRSFGELHHIGPDGLRVSRSDGDELLITTLGDSSIYGHGLGDVHTLHVLLEQDFSQRNVSVDVRCGGVPGYSTVQSLVLLDELLWDEEPDLIVIGNMWSDNLQAGFTDSELMEAMQTPRNRLALAISQLRIVQRFTDTSSAEPQGESQFVPVGWLQGVPQSGEERVPLDAYYENLHTMLDEAIEHEAGAVLLQPCARFLYEQVEHGNPAPELAYATVMARVGRERNVPVVDACQALAKARIPMREAFLDSLHPTGQANLIYAHAIGEAVTDRGWPDKPMLPEPRP